MDLNYGADGFFLRARFKVSLPGVEREAARAIVDEAHKTCPYSKALSPSIDVIVTLVWSKVMSVRRNLSARPPGGTRR